jgi:hypothetical protein
LHHVKLRVVYINVDISEAGGITVSRIGERRRERHRRFFITDWHTVLNKVSRNPRDLSLVINCPRLGYSKRNSIFRTRNGLKWFNVVNGACDALSEDEIAVRMVDATTRSRRRSGRRSSGWNTARSSGRTGRRSNGRSSCWSIGGNTTRSNARPSRRPSCRPSRRPSCRPSRRPSCRSSGDWWSRGYSGGDICWSRGRCRGRISRLAWSSRGIGGPARPRDSRGLFGTGRHLG